MARVFVTTAGPPGTNLGYWQRTATGAQWQEVKLNGESTLFDELGPSQTPGSSALHLRSTEMNLEAVLLDKSVQLIKDGQYAGEFLGHWEAIGESLSWDSTLQPTPSMKASPCPSPQRHASMTGTIPFCAMDSLLNETQPGLDMTSPVTKVRTSMTLTVPNTATLAQSSSSSTPSFDSTSNSRPDSKASCMGGTTDQPPAPVPSLAQTQEMFSLTSPVVDSDIAALPPAAGQPHQQQKQPPQSQLQASHLPKQPQPQRRPQNPGGPPPPPLIAAAVAKAAGTATAQDPDLDCSELTIRRLLSACEAGSPQEVNSLLLARADPDGGPPGTASHGLPLLSAAGRGSLEIVGLLLDHSADANIVSKDTTPMKAAFEAGHEAVVQRLFAATFQSLRTGRSGDRDRSSRGFAGWTRTSSGLGDGGVTEAMLDEVKTVSERFVGQDKAFKARIMSSSAKKGTVPQDPTTEGIAAGIRATAVKDAMKALSARPLAT